MIHWKKYGEEKPHPDEWVIVRIKRDRLAPGLFISSIEYDCALCHLEIMPLYRVDQITPRWTNHRLNIWEQVKPDDEWAYIEGKA